MSEHHCCVCGAEISHIQRCRGCKLLFCAECMETHITDNWAFVKEFYPERHYEKDTQGNWVRQEERR